MKRFVLLLLLAPVALRADAPKAVEATDFKKFTESVQEVGRKVQEARKSGNKLAFEKARKDGLAKFSSWVGSSIEWELTVSSVDAKKVVLRHEVDANVVSITNHPLLLPREKLFAIDIGKDIALDAATGLKRGDKLKVTGKIAKLVPGMDDLCLMVTFVIDQVSVAK